MEKNEVIQLVSRAIELAQNSGASVDEIMDAVLQPIEDKFQGKVDYYIGWTIGQALMSHWVHCHPHKMIDEAPFMLVAAVLEGWGSDPSTLCELSKVLEDWELSTPESEGVSMNSAIIASLGMLQSVALGHWPYLKLR